MNEILSFLYSKCPAIKKDISEWDKLFKDILIAYDYFNQEHENGLKEPKFKINHYKYQDVIRHTISDVVLILFRYGLTKDCDNFKGISKNKFLGSFIFHFMRILPAEIGTRKDNAYIILFMLSFVKEPLKSFDCGMSDELKKEFFFFIRERHITTESIYFFLQALCHQNDKIELSIIHKQETNN